MKNLLNEQENIIKGPNWKIIKPTKQDIQNYKNSLKCHSTIEKECLLCHSKFYGNRSKQKFCYQCEVFFKCNNCNIFLKKK